MHLPTPGSGMADRDLQKLSARAREASDFLKALSHHTRLIILCLLTEGEKTVGELEESLGIQQAMVSQQLARLRLDGLVSSRRDGRLIYYSVAHPDTTGLLRFLLAMFPGKQDN
ncbi:MULTISPECIES: metalloregulator ArsR/SmtB family transcription factor [unclassified Rhizobium]|uniref:ArsR/SmtB family transcription factor n=1 Tax=unclassified Rhizobium TaxID=2613769 RepID=UPI0016225CE7|nr:MULTISPECIES: metalloregulator ArsR/SmtB family transcription factor [unclassified Rhizobium]MBB3542672.1 DNA-binding transcriptional ArsR family regulator [Rhizobium sp. BK399]MCS3739471.1 DNA-binding transcriptional ArsR family regulator [Rhizobium sp. BK661]MCS4091322.1 DNA-binding transcriptional ArsR family regulator [Rhizobium sp. BK176]